MKNIFPLPAEKIAENITESNVAIELQAKGISPVYKKNKIKIIIIILLNLSPEKRVIGKKNKRNETWQYPIALSTSNIKEIINLSLRVLR